MSISPGGCIGGSPAAAQGVCITCSGCDCRGNCVTEECRASKRAQEAEAKTPENSAERQKIRVLFKTPRASFPNEKGFTLAEAEVEYAFIPCAGELHIAYSVVPGSVRLRSNLYQFRGKRHDVDVKPPQLSAVSIHFKVSSGVTDYIEFDDAYAAEALGFGCFSGQTRKVGLLSKIIGPKATQQQIDEWANQVTVDARANEALTSADAESQIAADIRQARAEASKKEAAADDEQPAETAAAEKSASDERYEAAMRDYRRLEAERQRKIAEIEAQKQAMAAQQAAQAARAQAVQEEFRRQVAEHQAQVDSANRARAEYEAQLRSLGLTPPAQPAWQYSANLPPPVPSSSPPSASVASPSTASPEPLVTGGGETNTVVDEAAAVTESNEAPATNEAAESLVPERQTKLRPAYVACYLYGQYPSGQNWQFYISQVGLIQSATGELWPNSPQDPISKVWGAYLESRGADLAAFSRTNWPTCHGFNTQEEAQEARDRWLNDVRGGSGGYTVHEEDWQPSGVNE